jgi:hypothetical protein
LSEQFEIRWIDRGHPPRVKPNPDFPDGRDVDSGERPACLAKLPYPTGKDHVGGWFLRCQRCGTTAYVTAASRPDDPKSIMIPCKMKGSA